MEWDLFSILRILIETCLVFGAYYYMLTPKYSLWKTIAIGYTGNIAAILCYWSVFPLHFQMPLFVAVNLLTVHLSFCDKWLRKIYSVFLVYLGFIFIEISFVVVCLGTTGMSMEEMIAYTMGPSPLLLTFYIVFAVYLKCLTQVFSKRAGVLSWKGQKNFLLVPVCQLLMLYGLICCANQTNSPWVSFVLCISDFLTLFTSFFLFRSMDAAFQGVRAEERLHYLEEQQKMQAEYYQELAQHASVIRRLRHDIANHVQTMGILLQNKDYNQAEQYFSRIQGVFQDAELPLYCENAMVNAVLNHKISQAKAQKIKVEPRLTLPAQPGFDPIDLTVLFLNLMDNALEGAAGSPGEKWVRLSDHWAGRLYTATVTNSKSPQPVRMKNGRPVSTKPDRLLHGQGSAILVEIAEKYQGSVLFQDEGEQFSTVVLLQAPDGAEVRGG